MKRSRKPDRPEPSLYIEAVGAVCPPRGFDDMIAAAKVLTRGVSKKDQAKLKALLLRLVSDDCNILRDSIECSANAENLPYNVAVSVREIGLGKDRDLHRVYSEAAQATTDPVGSTAAFLVGFLRGIDVAAGGRNRDYLEAGRKFDVGKKKSSDEAMAKHAATLREFYRQRAADPDAKQTTLYKRVVVALAGRDTKTSVSAVSKCISTWMAGE